MYYTHIVPSANKSMYFKQKIIKKNKLKRTRGLQRGESIIQDDMNNKQY